MDFLLKGFAKEFQAKHGIPGQNAKSDAAKSTAGEQKPTSAAKPLNAVNAANMKETNYMLDCGCIIRPNKENKPESSSGAPLTKSQEKKLKRKKKLAKKAKAAEAKRVNDDLPTTSNKTQKNVQTKQNNGAIPKVKSKNNAQKIEKSATLEQSEVKVEQPKKNNLKMNKNKVTSNAQTKTKNNIAKMSTEDKENKPDNKDAAKNDSKPNKQPNNIAKMSTKGKENKSENKDAAQNSAKNDSKSNKQPVKNKKPNKTAQPKKKEEPEPTGANKAVATKPPRHSALLKPLIFDVRNEDLLLWARDFQKLVVESMGCTKQTMPFYEIGRHFGMRATVTDNDKVMDMFKNFLTDRKAGYFSYTSKENLRTLLVLKKPSALKNCIPELVANALRELKIPVVRVELFKAMWKPKCSYNRFLVEVDRGVDLQQLFKQTTLLQHDKWHWSKLKKPSISQCRNCQRYGHVASNCRMPYRCVKCKEPHEVAKCPRSIKKHEIKDVYCHNCKKTGHPSNYRGCPAYKERCEALDRQRAYSRFSAVIKRVVFSVNKALEKDKSK